jgi:hypothetical protein
MCSESRNDPESSGRGQNALPDIEFVESLHEVIRLSPNPEEEWLWCIVCERFFQARYLRIDYLGNRQGCAYCDCAGFDCAIFSWDIFKEDDDPTWPDSPAMLRNGLRLGR